MCVCFYLDLDVNNNNIENLVKHVIVYIYIYVYKCWLIPPQYIQLDTCIWSPSADSQVVKDIRRSLFQSFAWSRLQSWTGLVVGDWGLVRDFSKAMA